MIFRKLLLLFLSPFFTLLFFVSFLIRLLLTILKGRGYNGYHGNYLKWRMNWKK